MHKIISRSLAAGAACLGALLAAAPATATLVGRDLDLSSPGFEAYYDTSQNITWLADGNYARSAGRAADGLMSFDQARSWASQLDIHGVQGWRLPVFRPEQLTNCPTSVTGAGCGHAVSPERSELVNLMRLGLGLRGVYDSGPEPTVYSVGGYLSPWPQLPGVDPGVVFKDVNSNYWSVGTYLQELACPTSADCSALGAPDGLDALLTQNGGYWSADGQTFVRCLVPAQCLTSPLPGSSTPGAPRPGYYLAEVQGPWAFDLVTGELFEQPGQSMMAAVWLVRDGDVVSLVPEPGSALLAMAGLIALGLHRRRQLRASRCASA